MPSVFPRNPLFAIPSSRASSDVLVTVLSLDVMLKVVVRLLVEVKVLRVELTVTSVASVAVPNISEGHKGFR